MNKKILPLVILLGITLALGFVSAECTETDSGIDLYTKGSITGIWLGDINGPVSTHEDVCSEFDTNSLQEFTCELVEGTANTYGIVQTGFDCARGCNDGACIPLSCEDSDNGDNFYKKGSVKVVAEDIEDKDDDTCVNNDLLAEQSCVNGQQKITMFECLGGCNDGACLKIEPTEETGPIELPEELTKTEETEDEKKIICNGCVLEDKCFPFGFRKSGSYCSEVANQFTEQKQSESICENNFECSSNVCVSGECISEGLIQKILNWFKRLF